MSLSVLYGGFFHCLKSLTVAVDVLLRPSHLFHKEAHKGIRQHCGETGNSIMDLETSCEISKTRKRQGKSEHEKKLIVQHPCLLHWDLKYSYFQRTL